MFGYIMTFCAGAAVGALLVAANHKSVERAAAAARKQAIFDCERRQGEINAAYRRGVYDRKERGRGEAYEYR